MIEKLRSLIKRVFTCSFCGIDKSLSTKTDISYKGRWYPGCQNCFFRSIDNPMKFNNEIYPLINIYERY